MAKICPNCGAEAPDQFRFCGFCAATLDVAVPEPASAEPALDEAGSRSARRLVTMLFADLTNYTHAASRIDPEEMFLAIRRTLEHLAQPVQRLGGRIDRYVGDGFLATFGIPEAHEDDPIRGVLTALEMQQAMHTLRREVQQSLGWDVQLRVGVNLGPVISGPLETGAVPDASVFGHAVNVAHRLQQNARPGTVLVSEAVYRLTRSHFEYRDPITLQVKGLDSAVITYEVIGQRSAPLPSRGLAGRTTPLVGRAAESSALLAALQRLKVERQGMIALVTGEPGIGKSRLVDEVLAPLTNHFTIVRAAASPTEVTSYGLLTRLIEDLAGIAPDDNRATREQRLDDWLAPASPLAHDIGPVLQNLVSGQTSREGLIGNPQQDQRRIYAAMRRLIAWQARRRAILLVVDDLHWADPSSLAVLAHVADLVREAPLGIIGLARPNEIGQLAEPFAPNPADPVDANYRLQLDLQPLSPAESDQLLNLLLTEVPAPPELLSQILQRTSGNPLLMEEVVRMLMDEGIVRATAAGGWEVAPQWGEAVQKVPMTLNGLILSRYDRQPAPLRATLDAAAVLGNSFALPLLLGVTGEAEPELRRQLASLEQADFLRRAPGTGLPVFVFRHWLLQEAIYQTILQKERRALHLRAAQVIQQMAESLAVDMAARVGYHLECGQSRQAIGYLMMAARRAADRFANEEAIAYYQRIQALLDQHGARQEEAVDVALGLTALLARTNQMEAARETLEKARGLSLGPPTPGYRLADVMFQFGQLRSRAGQHAEARAAFEAAAANLREGAAADGNARGLSLSDIEREIGWLMFEQGQLAEARSRAESALRLALQAGDLPAAASAHNLLAGAHYWAGQISEAVSSSLRSLAIAEQLGDVWDSASTQSNLGKLYFKLNQWAQAEAHLRQAIFVQQEIGDYRNLGGSWSALGLLLLDAGRYEEALHAQNQALAALRGREELYPMAVRYLARGTVWLRLGVATWATADIERSLQAADQVNNSNMRAAALSALAEARLIESDLDQARELLQRAEALSEDSGSLETRAEVLRVRALLRQAERDWDRALEANQQSQDLFRQLGNRYEVARRQVEAAELTLARAGAARLPNGTATAAVREALETFRSLHAAADIPRAENLLSRLSSGLGPGSLGEQMVVVVHLHLELPDLEGESEAKQEELASLFGRISTALEKVGRERGATVATSGPGLVYLFSSPTLELTESLGQQAVQGAQDAVDTAARLNRASRRANSLEIGLSIGMTAGHWPAASTDPQEAAIFGSASQPGRQAQAAARLAGPNAIALSGDLTQVLRNTYELEVLDVQSQQRAVGPVFRLGRIRPQTQLAQPLPGSSPRLIGRQAELTALTGWVDRVAADRRGAVCYLEAEAGMGKTRLLDQVLAHARPKALCLLGKCESFRAGMSYWPLLTILEQAALPETPLLHQLQGLLGLRSPDDADAHLLRNLPPTMLRQEIFARVRALLLESAAERPVLVVIEDIHWLDLSSLELIDYLLPVTQEAPVALMLVARAEMPGPHRALVRKAEQLAQGRYLPVSFTGLSLPETRALVAALLDTEALPDGLWALLQPFSGHPLSMEEALRFLVESGWLWEAGQRWQVAYSRDATGGSTAAGADRRMPPTFRDLLLRRLDLLPSETLHVLQAAAVLGESFDHTVLSHVVGGPAVSRRLSELVERGWLLPASPENPLLFRFKHTLTRETIYATLLTSKLRVLHQRAGEALESLYPEAQAENVEVLAYHFGHSSLREKALGYLVRAAQSAAARHALNESLQYYQQARDIVAQLPAPQTRLAATIALGLADIHIALGDPANAVADLQPQLELPVGELPAEMRAGCWRRLGAAKRRMGEFGEALEDYQVAREVLTTQPEVAAAVAGARPASMGGDGLAALPAAAGDGAEREALTIELGLAQTLFDMRQFQRARVQAEHTLRAIDRRRYPELAAETLNVLGGTVFRMGESEPAYELVRDSLATYQAYGNRGGAANAYANLGVLAATRQDVETAYNNFALSLGLREALGDSAGIATTRNNLGNLERNRGHFAEAIQHLTVAAERARHAELNPLLAQSLANLGHALTLAGQRGQALAVLDDAELICQNYGLKNLLCEVLWKRAECQLESDDLPAAERAAEAALTLANDLNSSDLRSEGRRVLSRLYRRTGQTGAALEHAGAAWVARVKDPNPVMRARFAAEYALAQAAAGQTTEARRLLDDHVNAVQLPESAAMLREVAAAMAEM
jgi:predicted ATPase/class 3 adenylate cyclase